MRQLRILLDLDGVITDFVGGVQKLYNLKMPYPSGEYDIIKVIQREHPSITKNIFWNSVGYEFWTNLQFLPDGLEILTTLEQMGHKICILTSPTLDPYSLAGKYEWIANHLPRYRRFTLIGAAKGFCARPDAVLIDDRSENCEDFVLEGGRSILVPRPWNRCHNLLLPIPKRGVPEYISQLLEAMFS